MPLNWAGRQKKQVGDNDGMNCHIVALRLVDSIFILSFQGSKKTFSSSYKLFRAAYFFWGGGGELGFEAAFGGLFPLPGPEGCPGFLLGQFGFGFDDLLLII